MAIFCRTKRCQERFLSNDCRFGVISVVQQSSNKVLNYVRGSINAKEKKKSKLDIYCRKIFKKKTKKKVKFKYHFVF